MTTEERLDRLERAVGEMQRALYEFHGQAPNRNLDLIELPPCAHTWVPDHRFSIVSLVCSKCGKVKD